jgi:predicted Rossmann-fold nucleotide-binding protein
MNNTIRPRRLFVSGGSRLSANAALLWKELGVLLALENDLIVITGGLAGRKDEISSQTADSMIVEGMKQVLKEKGKQTEGQIETFLPDKKQDWNNLMRFEEGKMQILKNRNAQSRRFRMVHSADVVISIEGEVGTRSILDVALAIERPILPLPFGGGASKKVWQENREDILNWFQIKPDEAEYIERICLEKLIESEIKELAKRVNDCLLRGFTQGCFVIMQIHKEKDPVFDKAISPALKANRFQPWRTDRSIFSGDLIEAIHDGLRHCRFVIADTTDDRPNVMYELGFAHASNKTVILLRHANPDGSISKPPFDFQNHHILNYTDDLNDLRRRLKKIIAKDIGKGF